MPGRIVQNWRMENVTGRTRAKATTTCCNNLLQTYSIRLYMDIQGIKGTGNKYEYARKDNLLFDNFVPL